jgi:hypothetical protein
MTKVLADGSTFTFPPESLNSSVRAEPGCHSVARKFSSNESMSCLAVVILNAVLRVFTLSTAK